MGGDNYKQKISFALFNMFKTKKPRRGDDVSGISDEFMKAYRVFPSDEDRRGDDVSGISDEFMKAYRVFPSDEDRGRWIAEPGIDRKASAYIATTQANWNSSAVSN